MKNRHGPDDKPIEQQICPGCSTGGSIQRLRVGTAAELESPSAYDFVPCHDLPCYAGDGLQRWNYCYAQWFLCYRLKVLLNERKKDEIYKKPSEADLLDEIVKDYCSRKRGMTYSHVKKHSVLLEWFKEISIDTKADQLGVPDLLRALTGLSSETPL